MSNEERHIILAKDVGQVEAFSKQLHQGGLKKHRSKKIYTTHNPII